MNAPTLIELCRECAHDVYGHRRPSPRYGESVARLLMGTAAAESLLVHRRQIGYSLDRLDGAWGLWQTEQAAVGDNVRYLMRRADVCATASEFLFAGNGELRAVLTMGTQGLLKLIHDDDRFACLMARVHYLRVVEAVPEDLRGQAGYWKRYYNTKAGKGTIDGYINKWQTLIAPSLGD